MLKRLNASGGDEDQNIGVPMVPDGFVRAVEGKMTDEKVETGVSVEVDEWERKQLRKERKRKREMVTAKETTIAAHDGTSSAVAPFASMDTASIVSPSPAVSTKPPRRMA